MAGLVVAALLLAPWRLDFAVDTRTFYLALYDRARGESTSEHADWLVAAGLEYQRLRETNAARVWVMSALSGLLALLLVIQTLAWIAELLR